MISKKIFYNKKILVTGHTGFKGSWLTEWLKQLGAKVTGISLKPPTKPSHFISSKIGSKIKDLRIDIRNKKILEKKIIEFQPDFVFHLAAQPLVGLSYKDPALTWQTNVLGTLNVLESLKKLNKKCNVVIITSDKCYFNKEKKNYGYKETDILGGKDPYSSSKASAEILIKSFVNSYFLTNKTNIRIATARAGNVIGGGDWSENRIVPDCIKCWSKGKKTELRNPKATRPWQHVLEAVGGYICLAANLKLNKNLHGESFNFGPNSSKEYSVLELVKAMSKHWKKVSWKIAPKSKRNFYESELLRLNCNKAKKYLKWSSVLNFNESIEMVSTWYKEYYSDRKKINQVTKNQIKKYQFLVSNRGLKWGKKFLEK